MNTKTLLSLGSALAASRAVQMLTHLNADDVLCAVGLERKRNSTAENAALIGLGVFLGAGTALLLAPTNGQQARQRVAESFDKAREAGASWVNQAKERGPELVESAKQRLLDVTERADERHHA